ncbi:glycosyltransferase family 2 protein [Novosphingobium sp.]|uniref:glycosyltransferase family 2 protein n=1 Tax=Novosphingobium sp. TaxID=1874826 RepID=UPI003C7B8392
MAQVVPVVHSRDISAAEAASAPLPDVSIIMPCLNERESLPFCISNAKKALALIAAKYGLSGEIVIADNGSTDGSQWLAETMGARVQPVDDRGYGAALIGGCRGAKGRFLLMGDADGSYDFTDGVAMIGRLTDGADLCMGSRFLGGIAPGAMPWKNRYIGNPILTGMLNLFFRSGIDDAHCGIRAITKEAFTACELSSTGMEFASEMVIKAKLRNFKIDQVPATLSPDLRERAPHLRPWRDGWRHLRYLLMLSPTWLFGVPALLALALGSGLLGAAAADYLVPGTAPQIGQYWTLLGSTLMALGHLALLMALAGHLYGIRAGYRQPTWITRLATRFATLETMLVSGLALIGLGGALLVWVALGWAVRDYQAARTIFPPVVGTLAVTLGMQTVLGGFLMAIIAGHSARFFDDAAPGSTVR